MPVFRASAPAKIILFGEHAVVYGQPAIAVPLNQLRARVTVQADLAAPAGRVRIEAPDIGLQANLDELPAGNPLAAAIQAVGQALQIDHFPACTLRISSDIPVASGLGSGAAVSVALLRALAGFLGQPLPDDQVCALAYEIEKLHHGTPSGIDNSVVTYAHPVFFRRDQPVETFYIARPFTLVIADSGIPSPTRESVGDVRRAWQVDPTHYEQIFAAIGKVVLAARTKIEQGQPEQLGPLMDQNHTLLQEMGVSSPELDRLVLAARQAGALGAKLSGGGRGGNMLALVDEATVAQVAQALTAAGASHTITTVVGQSAGKP